MIAGPLVQAPALDNLVGRVKLQVFSGNVAVKELELATLLGAFKKLGDAPGEGADSVDIGECLVQLVGGSTELVVVGYSHSIDLAAGGRGLARSGSSGSRCGLGVNLGSGESTGGVGARGVLDVLAMLGDQGIG